MPNEESYRARLNRQRIPRRTLLRGTGASLAGVAGAVLLGCGDGDEADEPTAAAGSATPAATSGGGAATATATAGPAAGTPRRGGTMVQATTVDVDTFDVLIGKNVYTTYPTAAVYSRLIKFDHGDGGAAPGTTSGDLVESIEQPDELQYIFKLKEGVTYDERSPTNGRELTTDDVMASWGKYSTISNYRKNLNNAENPGAPVREMTAIDDKTLQIDLAFPDAIFLPLIAGSYNLWIHPREAIDLEFDPGVDTRGTGPWILDEYRPAVSYKYVRNPNWHGGPDRPYLDGYENLIITDNAQVEAQFRAGNLDFGGQANISVENQPSVVSSIPDANIVVGSPPATGSGIGFSYNAGQPWADIRLRRALSMSIDRDVLADVLYSPENLRSAGADINVYWNNTISAGFGEFWLDPQSPEFGPSAQYMRQNIPEAKKLLAAAGYTDDNPFEFELVFTPRYRYESRSEVVQAQAAAAGIKINLYAADYTTSWIPDYLRAHTNFESSSGSGFVAQYPAFSNQNEPGLHLQTWYATDGPQNQNGGNYPEMDAMIKAQRGEFDHEARVQKIHDIQRWNVENCMTVAAGPGVEATNVAYTSLHGPDRYQVWPGGVTGAMASVETYPWYWKDEA